MLPIHEAVINAFHATEGNPPHRPREITVTVRRDFEQAPLDEEEGPYFLPVKDVAISDNGVGFDSTNFDSFKTSDTTMKAQYGGKGIGRFLWLKAFESVSIDSIFQEAGRTFRRAFEFVPGPEGIENESRSEVEDDQVLTTVELKSLKFDYRRSVPKKLRTFAYQILEHLLPFFVLEDPPAVAIRDDDNDERVRLDKLFETEVKPNLSTHTIEVKNSTLNLTLVSLFSTMASVHRLYYCAHGREVRQEELRSTEPLLDKRLTNDEGHEYVLLAYLSGEVLNATVNAERTSFHMSETGADIPLYADDLPTVHDLRHAAIARIREALRPVLEPLRTSRRERIEQFVNDQNPEYRAVLKYRAEQLESIPSGLSDDKLELELHRLSQDLELEIKAESQRMFSIDAEDITQSEQYRDAYERLVNMVNDHGKGKLAEYVIHRNIVLELLRKRLERDEAGRNYTEESIHGLVFPLRSDSDDMDFEKQNLWLIDEKLSYHYYLASDKPLRQLQPTGSQSSSRPDLVIFNNPLAFAEDDFPYSSIVVVEFKRPVRNDYNDEENPIAQVQNYIREIRSNQALDRNGRPFNINPATPFYAYIVCDLTRKLDIAAENHSLQKTPDQLGYYGYNPNLNCYMEVISLNKLLTDAKKRNHVLFKKLGISSAIAGSDV